MIARIISQTSFTKREILDWDDGLTLGQLQVMLEEVAYQDNLDLARSVQALQSAIPALAAVMGAMMSGESGGITSGLQSMANYVQTLVEGPSAPSEEQRQQQDELLKHPMFEQFRRGNRGGFKA